MMKLRAYTTLWLICSVLQWRFTQAFLPGLTIRSSSVRRTLLRTWLQTGRGITANYTWIEEPFEMDVSVVVPANTRTKDLRFTATTTSIELKLVQNDTEVMLLDPTRPLRGRVNLDGTYWVLGDIDGQNKTHRTVTVTIEKLIQAPQDDFEDVEVFWKGVYRDDSNEVTFRHYDEPEPFNVRRYAANMGVDIDNINMSMVDKSMFSSTFNLNKTVVGDLIKSGYAQEVTQQADGTQYAIDDEGEPERVPTLQEEMGERRVKIPLIDDDSPWKTAVPVYRDPETNKTYIQKTRNFTQAAFAEDAAQLREEKEKMLSKNTKEVKDPIDTLTVARLKEVLKSQGLSTSGTKQELRDRLRARVNALLQGRQN